MLGCILLINLDLIPGLILLGEASWNIVEHILTYLFIYLLSFINNTFSSKFITFVSSILLPHELSQGQPNLHIIHLIQPQNDKSNPSQHAIPPHHPIPTLTPSQQPHQSTPHALPESKETAMQPEKPLKNLISLHIAPVIKPI